MNKSCTKCDKILPATLEYFPPDERNKNGLQARCRKCCNEVTQEWQSGKGKSLHKRTMEKYYSTLNGYLHRIYNGMKNRCTSLKHPAYNRYGGRGIKVKFKSSNEFVDYVINELQVNPRNLQIDRIDNDGHYEKGNIRFVTAKENSNNRRPKR